MKTLKAITDGKKHAHKKYLHSRSREDYISYKKLRAEVRKLSKTKKKRQDWVKFVKPLEHDTTEAQRIGFKTFIKLKMEEDNKLKIKSNT
jgi:hypothetical protein